MQASTPQLWRDYDGGELVLPGDPAQILSPATNPLLAERVGHDIVTSDGTTLLGADDKAGVAEIMSAAAWLLAHPEVPRARTRIGFTVDEEVGPRHRPLRPRALRRRLRLHARRRRSSARSRTRRSRAVELKVSFHGRRHPSRLREGEARQPDQAGRALRREPPCRPALARDDRGTGGLSCTRSRSPATRPVRP